MASVLVTGATGFVGTKVVEALGDHQVRALVRSAKSQVPTGSDPVVGDVTDPSTLTRAVEGVDMVIHLVGIIEETRGATFDGIIRQGSANVIEAARQANVKHVILMSALGAKDEPSLPYMQAKYRSEEHLKASGMPFTIFRPSVIFGPGDGFINTLAGVIKAFPVTPVVGTGQTRFSPVAVSDVADAFAATADDPARAMNATIELGGGETVTYEQMLDLLAKELGKSRPKVRVPLNLMKAVVSIAAPLPKSLRPPVTPEQLNMLALDNSTSPESLAALIGHPPKLLTGNISYVRA